MEYTSPYETIIFMGRAGTGKGTQATKLAALLQYGVFSTGDKAREYAAQDTPLGRTIAKIHTTGWIPEWVASYVMTKAIVEDYADTGLIFESVARKPEEARKLNEIHTHLERSYIVIYLDGDKAVLKERLLLRGREGYDTEEKIDQRTQAFEDETLQSITFFEEQGKLRTIDANRSVEEVFQEILTVITELN